MFPWLWIFAPTTYWPFSGAVSQEISPDTFFNAIRPGAGVPGIEKRVFEQASYGKQLGWLTDVLVDSIDGNGLKSAEAQAALDNLKELRTKMKRIKDEHRHDQADAAIALLDRIEADSPDELRRVLVRFAAGRALRFR